MPLKDLLVIATKVEDDDCSITHVVRYQMEYGILINRDKGTLFNKEVLFTTLSNMQMEKFNAFNNVLEGGRQGL